MGLGPPELIVILIIVLVLFGGARLPKLARSLGQAKKEFEHGINEGDKDNRDRPRDPEARPPTT